MSKIKLTDWFEIDEQEYLTYILRGYEITISSEYGYISWILNGKYHREDGPAVIHKDGGKRWYLNDKLHRKGGPAIIYSDGYTRWFLNGIECTEDEYG